MDIKYYFKNELENYLKEKIIPLPSIIPAHKEEIIEYNVILEQAEEIKGYIRLYKALLFIPIEITNLDKNEKELRDAILLTIISMENFLERNKYLITSGEETFPIEEIYTGIVRSSDCIYIDVFLISREEYI